MRKLSRYVDAVRQRAVPDFWDASTNTLAIASTLEYVNSGLIAGGASVGVGLWVASTSYPLYTNPNDAKTWIITGISYRFSTQATGAATFSLEVAGAAVAPGSGTAQASGMTLQGTANTTINVVPTTQTVFGAGTSVNVVIASTATTGLAGLNVTVTMQRVT